MLNNKNLLSINYLSNKILFKTKSIKLQLKSSVKLIAKIILRQSPPNSKFLLQ